ncbi:Lysine-ketoglutarate reductase/saccharopine dehydrogenase1 [Forsythia ovata]|uniref:Lysine-ketoglutarate reductase/saccharopine dehydrogenase1 n=1 Tax=Forsythia ovata TaxID=205694 RepID=A0ABD1PLI2_9LAMI
MALTVGIPAAIGAMLLLRKKIQTKDILRPIDPEIYVPEIIQQIKGAKVATVIFFHRDDCPFSSAAENFSLGRNGRYILTAAGNKMMPNFSTVLSPPLSSFCTVDRRVIFL